MVMTPRRRIVLSSRRRRRKVLLSLGMGYESAAALVRWLLYPETRPCDLEDLVVVTAMTGEVLSPVPACCSFLPAEAWVSVLRTWGLCDPDAVDDDFAD